MNIETENSGYYRSRIFSLNNSINPLIAASTPLFLIAEKLKNYNFAITHSKLLQDLTHEIKAFENKSQVQGIRTSSIFTARTALCLMLDEIISETSWGKENNWSKHLLTNLQHNSQQKSFFEILNTLLETPAENLQLLELFYLILSFGYEGDYHYQANKQAELIKYRNDLYGIIHPLHNEINKSLLIQNKNESELASKKKTKWKKIIILALGTFLTINLGLSLAFSTRLNSMVKPINELIKQHNDTLHNLGEQT